MQQWRACRLFCRYKVHYRHSVRFDFFEEHRPGYIFSQTPITLLKTDTNRIDIQGYVQFTNDTKYWQRSSFKQIYQNATTFFQLGGSDVNVYGGGTLDGNGQVWYDLYAKDIYTLRPILFGTVGLHGGSISDLKLRYSPQWFNFVANSSDIVFSNIDIAGGSKSSNTAKNTDGYVLPSRVFCRPR
jgi:polygalacturonase